MTRSTARRTLVALASAGLLVGTLAACQTEADDDPTPSASASATPSPSATPTPSAEPSATPTPTQAAPAVNGPNSITSPLAGDEVSSPVTATGEGTAFEATLRYRVLAAGTEDVVVEGWTEAGANGEIGPWSIELDLEPGTWTLEVWEPAMSETEGEGASDNRVAVTFTVV